MGDGDGAGRTDIWRRKQAGSRSKAFAGRRRRPGLFYGKTVGALANGGTLIGVTNYASGFGLKGLVQARPNPTRQFVGSYNVGIIPNPNGTLTFTVTNVTSATSAFYHAVPSWDRAQFGPRGNVSQTFTWTEQIRREP
jgi:hypothetical protein